MKVRAFYPRQVLRKLQGVHSQLGAAQKAALLFVMRRGRKLGYAVMAGPVTTPESLMGARSAQDAHATLANSPFRITLLPAV